MSSPSPDPLRRIPQVEKILRAPELEALHSRTARGDLVAAVRAALARVRAQVLANALTAEQVEARLHGPDLATLIETELARLKTSAYRRVINATGVVLHTGLGRAVLAEEARRAFQEELGGYSLVEVDPATGERNRREEAVARLLQEITGAESATVVNNNAGATLLILAALARGREVIVSRGQLVEIGGSFRIPDILRESGAQLVEVGTTNRTYARDYERAMTARTAMLLQVHTSNYEISGFVHQPGLEELVALARPHGVTVTSDLGSGCLVDLSPLGFRREPLVSESVQAGADVVCFSGDKLLGGPQCGIIVGARKAIDAVREHPLFRALRIDKTVLVLLEATLRAYLDPATLFERNPTLHLLSAAAEQIRERAERFLSRLRASAPALRLNVEVVPCSSQAGSGALPTQTVPSHGLSLRSADLPPLALARALRESSPPVFTRIQDEAVLLDFRTVLPAEEEELCRALVCVGV